MTSRDVTPTSLNHQRFQNAWPILRNDILGDFATKGMPGDAIDWYTKNLEYNTLGGKLLRGRAVVDSLAILKGRVLTDEEYFQAAVLGWSVELLQAFGLVADDIMDQSLTRRGHPCWYKVGDVGLRAINDACILEGTIFILLKKHFRGRDDYIEIVELFREMIYRTGMGQLLDVLTGPEHHVDLEKFSIERYRLIAIHKSAYFSIYLPIALAMLMHGIPRESPAHEAAMQISFSLGEYGQVQDDFIDFAGSPEHTGKVGTDIVNNKCSWCIITALALSKPEQRRVLEENYGRKGVENEGRVRTVFEQVGLREQYAAYEEETYRRVTRMIEAIPDDEAAPALKGGVFKAFLDKLYKRTK
ncbi:farnesyl-diphosphate synthase [Neolentinus lepideus HHB14362 ss-1]|uniref:(2E,6E)-farnesyl diphosphate synthase n=1 Tax=Neolentinus lepideus HHB14362 ss-1 TaxID=1314782 RepID=A0A165NKA0_9AGAM|nr:farnesyl-diphosphate synthase [Neolentinus lepideus HHB14362 ss-1]